MSQDYEFLERVPELFKLLFINSIKVDIKF